MRRMSKLAVRVAREALAAGRAALPEYGSRFSRRDYTQAQLLPFSCCASSSGPTTGALWCSLRSGRNCAARSASRRCRTTRRSPMPRAGSSRTPRLGGLPRGSGRGGPACPRARPDRRPPVAAVDATGLETRHVSAYFGLRRGTSPTRLAETHRRSPCPLAPHSRRGARRWPEPRLAGLHPDHAAGRSAHPDRHSPW